MILSHPIVQIDTNCTITSCCQSTVVAFQLNSFIASASSTLAHGATSPIPAPRAVLKRDNFSTTPPESSGGFTIHVSFTLCTNMYQIYTNINHKHVPQPKFSIWLCTGSSTLLSGNVLCFWSVWFSCGGSVTKATQKKSSNIICTQWPFCSTLPKSTFKIILRSCSDHVKKWRLWVFLPFFTWNHQRAPLFVSEPGPLWSSLAIWRAAPALGRGGMQQMPKLPLCLGKRIHICPLIWHRPQIMDTYYIYHIYIYTQYITYTIYIYICALTYVHWHMCICVFTYTVQT